MEGWEKRQDEDGEDAADAGGWETESYFFTSAWNAGTVTWNTRPALSCCSGSAMVGTTSSYYAWDVLVLANGWLHGSFANYGLALRGPPDISFERIFDCDRPTTGRMDRSARMRWIGW